MPTDSGPSLGLFLSILQTLERIGAPYVIIGAFAGTAYGVTRTTHDIDIVVDLAEEHIQSLVAQYPPPRYYADAEQMRESIGYGIMFNIIDTTRGEKADLLPVTMNPHYPQVIANSERQTIAWPGSEPFDAWYARPDDIIIGKLAAWTEGRSRKHEIDIFAMLVFQYLGLNEPGILDEQTIDSAATAYGAETLAFWQSAKTQAKQEAERLRPSP